MHMADEQAKEQDGYSEHDSGSPHLGLYVAQHQTRNCPKAAHNTSALRLK